MKNFNVIQSDGHSTGKDIWKGAEYPVKKVKVMWLGWELTTSLHLVRFMIRSDLRTAQLEQT